MSLWRPLTRAGLGTFVILHALAHATLPLRGLLEYPPRTAVSVITVVACSIAIVSLFAAGIGILGSRIFERHLTKLMAAGLVSSGVALTAGWDSSAWWGLAIDAVLLGAFAAARNTGLLPPLERGARHSVRRRTMDWLFEAMACTLVAYIAAGTVLWPWHRRWGTTAADRLLQLPGDEPIRNANYELMHAVTIEAPPEIVWAWACAERQFRLASLERD